MLAFLGRTLLALTLAVAHPAAAPPDVAVLTARLNAFLAGASRNDAAVHEDFWADDLVYTSSAGQRFGKEALMRDVRSAPAPKPGDPKTVYTAEDVRIRRYGTSAIVAFELVATTESGDSTHVAHYLNTGFFVKRGGIWRASGWQATKKP